MGRVRPSKNAVVYHQISNGYRKFVLFFCNTEIQGKQLVTAATRKLWSQVKFSRQNVSFTPPRKYLGTVLIGSWQILN